MKELLSILVLFLGSFQLFGQMDKLASERTEQITINGELVTALITQENDTILIADLQDVSISSPRKFANKKEEYRYKKYRRYAVVVYPYAVEAIRIFKETEYVTQNMKKRKKKRHIKRLQKELKKEFKSKLKNLTKTQGKILVKMIEKELDRPFYNLVKDLRGGMTASYYQTMGKMFAYNLKEGYTAGEDVILDAVLHDFNIKHDVEERMKDLPYIKYNENL